MTSDADRAHEVLLEFVRALARRQARLDYEEEYAAKRDTTKRVQG